MRVRLNVKARPQFLRAALRGLTAVNREVLREGQLPSIYASGVRYQPEALGQENWQRADETFARGFGDCEDLATWRAAELQLDGEVGAYADVVQTGARKYHAVVRRADGSIEDPSRALKR